MTDRKSLAGRVAGACGIDVKTAQSMMASLASVMTDALADAETIAIPGFGEFSPVKTDEHIETVDGHNMLIPPSVKVDFSPYAALRKQLGL